MRVETITTRRTQAAEKLELLRQQRGAAELDGAARGKLDAEIARAEADVSALMEAESEQANRERSEAVERAARLLNQNREELQSHFGKWLECADAAQQAAMDLVAVLREAEFAAAEIHRLTNLIGGKPHSDLAPIEMRKRLSNRLSNEFIAIMRKPEYGVLQFKPLPSLKPYTKENWRDAEERQIGPAIQTYFAKGNGNGTSC